jgi:hypothetical protein
VEGLAEDADGEGVGGREDATVVVKTVGKDDVAAEGVVTGLVETVVPDACVFVPFLAQPAGPAKRQKTSTLRKSRRDNTELIFFKAFLPQILKS